LRRAEISKGGSVLPSAQIQTAGETNRSRWDHARVRLLIPIGIMVVVAIIGIAVGVLSSAQRANRISTDNEEQAILRSLDENAERALRHLESVASMPQATTKIRDRYDAEWINRRVGEWLETFYNADIVAVFGIGGGPNISAPASRAKAPPPTWRPSSLQRLTFCAASMLGNRAALSWYLRTIYPSRPKPSLFFKIFWANPPLLPP
jgi:hypothetical protein